MRNGRGSTAIEMLPQPELEDQQSPDLARIIPAAFDVLGDDFSMNFGSNQPRSRARGSKRTSRTIDWNSLSWRSQTAVGRPKPCFFFRIVASGRIPAIARLK